MPLEFQPMEIIYGQLDTHTDPTAMEPGTLTKAENLTSQVDGRYSKRFGYDAITQAGTSAIRLARRDNELLAYDGQTQRKYIFEGTAWQTWVQSVPHATPSERNVALNQAKSYLRSTRATCDGMTLHAMIDSSTGNVEVKVTSVLDNSVLLEFTDSAADYEIIHAVNLADTRIVLFYSSVAAQVIKYRTFEPSSFTFGTLTTYLSGANVYAGSVPYPYAPFDIVAFSATDVCLAWASDTPDIRVIRRNVLAHTDSTAAVVLSTEVPDGGFAIETASSSFGVVAFHSSTSTAVRARGFNPTTSAAGFALVTVAGDAFGTTNFNVGMTDVNSTSISISLDQRKVSPAIGQTVTYTITSVGVVTLNGLRYNCWIAAKPFTYNNRQYLPVLAPYETQETYFTLDTTYGGLFEHVPVAMHAYRTAHSDGAAVACLSDADTVSTGIFAYNATSAYKFLSSSQPLPAATSYIMDFEDPLRFQNTQMGDSTFFTGGVTFQYDGQHVMENNFLLYPEIRSATPGSVGGSGMDNGVYSYLVVFEVADQNGNVDRSTTSLPVQATTSAGAGLGKVTLVIHSLNITHRTLSTRKVSASVFRTEASGETYYYLGSVTADVNSEIATYVDSAHDSTIIDNRIVYTQGGVLDREPAPPCGQLANHNNRLWGFTKETIFYSGDYVPGENPWFSTLQRFNIDSGGDITAIVSLDEKLIIFKNDRIFKVTGRGGNATGSSSDLTPPDVITSDCGCIDWRSVIVTPQGILFLSAKGIYMLTRGEELSFVGMPVDYYTTNYPTVTAATLMPDVMEVRFQVVNDEDDGVVLVYNYRDNRWTTHTNYDYLGSGGTGQRVDSLIIDGSYYTIDPDGYASVQTTGFRDPADTYVISELETGWIKPAGKQGLVRCQRIAVLNEVIEEHDIEIEIDKDYVQSSVQSATYTAAEIAALPQEQVSIHVQDQQGESWRLRQRDTESDGSNSEGFRARGVTLLVGVKRGTIEKIMQAGAKA